MNRRAFEKVKRVFVKGKRLWEERDYVRALECFLKVSERSNRKDWLRQIGERIGGECFAERLALGRNPVLSFDGKHLAFIANDKNGNWRIFLKNILCKEVRQLKYAVSADTRLLFSSDANYFAFISNKENAGSVCIAELKGGKEIYVTRIKGLVRDGDFSPDNKMIVFTCFSQKKSIIHAVDLNRGVKIQVCSDKDWNYSPRFAPNGNKIIFISYREKESKKKMHIGVFDVRKKTLTFFKAAKYLRRPLCFSPDNETVVIGSSEGLYSFNLDGKGRKFLHRNESGRGDWSPFFSKDGSKLVFISRTAKEDKAYLLHINNMRIEHIFSSKIPLAWVKLVSASRQVLFARQQSERSQRLFLADRGNSRFTSLGSDAPCGLRSAGGCNNISLSPEGKMAVYAYECGGGPDNSDQIYSADLGHKSIGTARLSARLKKLLVEERAMSKRSKRLFKSADPFIKELIARVSINNLKEHIQALQGFGSRYAGLEGCAKTGKYLYDQFSSYGLNTEYDDYEYPRNNKFNSRNIVATLKGKNNPEIIYVVSAHYDSAKGSPGAWDNASGVAAVLEAARILSPHCFDATIKFICFSGEEMGHIGSAHFARQAKSAGLNILGVLNNDSFGYLGNKKMEITIRYTSEMLRDILYSASATYTNLLTYASASPEDSDGLSFVKDFGNITALIQDYPYLPNPNWHGPGDCLKLLSLAKIKEVVKLNISALTVMVGCKAVETR